MKDSNVAVDAAVKSAVNGGDVEKTAHNVKVIEVQKEVRKEDKVKSFAAITEAYKLQAGIEDLQAKIERNKGGIGDQVLAIAKIARKYCESKGYNMVLTYHYFATLCSSAETSLVNQEIERNEGQRQSISALIPVWSTHKSIIGKGMQQFMLDPLERDETAPTAPKYATATQYANAVKAAETAANGGEATGTGSQAGNVRNTQQQAVNTLQLITKGWSEGISEAMQMLTKALNRLTHEEQDKFAPQLLTLAMEVLTFAESTEKAHADSSSPENQRTPEKKVAQAETGPSELEQELDPGTKAAMQAALDADKAPKAPEATDGKKPSTRKGARAA